MVLGFKGPKEEAGREAAPNLSSRASWTTACLCNPGTAVLAWGGVVGRGTAGYQSVLPTAPFPTWLAGLMIILQKGLPDRSIPNAVIN